MLESPLHENYLLRYDVEIVEELNETKSKTAIVVFYDENNKKASSHRFRVVIKEDIYKSIDLGESLNLSNAYVKDFSLSEYRRLES